MREKAVEAAVDWLEGLQRRDGSFGPAIPAEALGDDSPLSGNTALVYLTLAAAKEHRSTRVLKAAEKHLRSRYVSAMDPSETRIHHKTYALAAFVLGLEAQYGGRRVPRAARRMAQEISDWLISTQTPAGDWGYGREIEGAPPFDISNSAFALMALLAAKRLGAEVPHREILRTVPRLLLYQDRGGEPVARLALVFLDSPSGSEFGSSQVDSACGFRYVPGDVAATGSATAAGVLALLSCGELIDPEGTADRSLHTDLRKGAWNGVAWLSRTFSLSGNPKVAENGQAAKATHYYFIYLFLLQRVTAMLRLDSGDESKWYLRAAEAVVNAQTPDGSWGSGVSSPTRFQNGRLHDTCFAVLFLLGQDAPRSRLVPSPDRPAQTTPR